MAFNVFLLKRLREVGLKKRELARQVQVNPSTVTKWIAGKAKPKSDKIDLLAKALHVHPFRILELLGAEIPTGAGQFVKVHVLPGRLPCGTPRESIMDYIEDIIRISAEGFDVNPRCTYYGIRATGNSMVGKGICDGYLIIFTPDLEVLNGDVAVVSIDDKLCARIVRYREDSIVLLAANPAYDPIVIPKEEEYFRILGKVVGVQGNPNRVNMNDHLF